MKNFKYNIKKKLMYYKKNVDSLNILIKVVIKLNNKLYKLAIKIYYSKTNNGIEAYFRYKNYYIK